MAVMTREETKTSQARTVLALVNLVRTKLGKQPLVELLPGQQYEPGHCPLANSLGSGHVGHVYVDWYLADKVPTRGMVAAGVGVAGFPTAADAAVARKAWGTGMPPASGLRQIARAVKDIETDPTFWAVLPEPLSAFMRAFDQGSFPEYEANRGER